MLDVFQKNPLFSQLYEDLLRRNDEYFVLKDFAAYREAHQEILRRYQDRPGWLRASAVNIAQSGHFSSDRTVSQYARDIWKVKPIRV